MNLLIVPVPLFNENIAVQAYYFRYRKGNGILDGASANMLDGAMIAHPLEMLNMVSLEALTMGKPIFVPITKYMLLGRLESQCMQPEDKIVFLIDGTEIGDVEQYLGNIARLKSFGYRFGCQKVKSPDKLIPLLEFCDFVFYDSRAWNEAEEVKAKLSAAGLEKSIQNVYTHIDTCDIFKHISTRYRGLYEGRFYRTPLTKGKHEVSPLQANLINLMNMVRDDSFEFSHIASVIQKDPALTVSLLRLVNSAFFALKEKVKTISQAVVMLGQTEVSKWITTAVAKLLGADRPGEVTRISLIRAKFAEELAVKFGMEKEAQSLFLMGLFSVLDAILDMPLEEALKLVHVSDEIYSALSEGKGAYADIYKFMIDYESANWNSVSRTLILEDMKASDVYDAYVKALVWYNNLIGAE
ncbi:MAG: HDOD domain-containing protein [Clostridiales Family XIII bacterium]|jgi:EAL and modified HD-GYP domain-containing signal transduction protein|nr:HDOD domain-containing protein [Clostridiales Family XIII bacterium]